MTPEQEALFVKWTPLAGWAVKHWRLLSRLVGPEDVYATALLVIWRAVLRYDGVRDFGKFARSCIRFAMRTRYNQHTYGRDKASDYRTARTVFLDDTPPQIDEGRVEPWSNSVEARDDTPLRELREVVRCGLDDLPAKLRYVVEQVYLEGRTRIDVARELGLGDSRIGQLLFLALRKLRRKLERQPCFN